MVRLACLAIGYLFGIFQTAYIYGRINGIDIREYGSGNAGTTNALRVLGKKAGLIVFLGDVAKTVLAVVVVRLLFGATHTDMLPLTRYVSLGSILVVIELVVCLIVLGQNGYYGMNQGHLIEFYMVAALLAAMAIYRHRANIRRLLNGTESKVFQKK